MSLLFSIVTATYNAAATLPRLLESLCVEALLLAAMSPDADGRVFNLGGDKVVSLRELADTLVNANGGGEYILSVM